MIYLFKKKQYQHKPGCEIWLLNTRIVQIWAWGTTIYLDSSPSLWLPPSSEARRNPVAKTTQHQDSIDLVAAITISLWLCYPSIFGTFWYMLICCSIFCPCFQGKGSSVMFPMDRKADWDPPTSASLFWDLPIEILKLIQPNPTIPEM
jgi:hypothetical protein